MRILKYERQKSAYSYGRRELTELNNSWYYKVTNQSHFLQGKLKPILIFSFWTEKWTKISFHWNWLIDVNENTRNETETWYIHAHPIRRKMFIPFNNTFIYAFQWNLLSTVPYAKLHFSSFLFVIGSYRIRNCDGYTHNKNSLHAFVYTSEFRPSIHCSFVYFGFSCEFMKWTHHSCVYMEDCVCVLWFL